MNKVSVKSRIPKRSQILVSVANINRMTHDRVSQLNYSDPGRTDSDSGYSLQSQSALSDALAGEVIHVDFKSAVNPDKTIYRREVKDMTHIFYVDLNIESDEPTNEQIALQEAIVRDGFYYFDKGGVKRKAVFLMQTPSQARQLQAIFVAEHVIKPIEALEKLGHNFLAYAKEKDGRMVIDVSKAATRFGLSGTSSIPSRLLKFGKEIIEHKNGDISIVGGPFSIRVVEDPYVVIKEGQYMAFDKINKEFRTFDASEHPITLTAGDGNLYYNERVYNALSEEFGVKVGACQVRITPFSKGLAVYIPNLEKYFDEDIVILKSSCKGNYKYIIEDHDVVFRIVLFNKPGYLKKKYVNLPYQFVHIMKLSTEDMIKLVEPHLKRVADMLEDPALIGEYLGLESLNNINDLSESDQEDLLNKTLVSTLAQFVYYAPFTYKDAHMKRLVLKTLKDLVKEWSYGSIPVEGNYRFMVHDPYPILEALASRGTKNEKRDSEGRLLVREDRGLKAGTVFMMERDGYHIKRGKVALFRNPAITKGEAALVTCAAPQNYVQATARGAFENVVVMSLHDFNTVRQGGADFDGDTTLPLDNPIIVEAVEKVNKVKPAILDLYFEERDGQIVFGEGCPWESNLGMNFDYAFYKEEYGDKTKHEIYELMKEFVVRNMKPNKIGFMTNIATKLADAVRAMGYRLKEENLSNSEKKELIMKIKKFESWIDLLRLVQGWEIDRAKHGGAYEDELRMQLDFIENPPAEVSEYSKKTGKRVWFTPDWMAARKGLTGKATGSVLSRIHKYISEWIEENLDKEVERRMADIENNNILAELAAAIHIERPKFELLKDALNEIRKEYASGIMAAIKRFESSVVQANQMFNNPLDKMEHINKADFQRNMEIHQVIETAQARIAALEASFTPEEIGYVAYWLTYTNSKARKGFPWSAAKRQLLLACKKAAGTKGKVTIPKVEPADVKVGFYGANYFGYTTEHVSKVIGKTKVVGFKLEKDPMTGNMAYFVYVAGRKVGLLYNTALAYINGSEQFVANVKDIAKVSNTSIQLVLEDVKPYF